jgi:hypothetical protein
MSHLYVVDLREWPAKFDLLLGGNVEPTAWLPVEDVPSKLATSAMVDFDARGRCCGVEVLDLNVIAPWNDGGEGSESTLELAQGAVFLPPADGGGRRIRRWIKGITSVGGAGDPHLSVHWGRAKSYSDEIEDLGSGLDWLTIGVCDERFVGVRVQDPSEHVRGLGPGFVIGSYVLPSWR